MTIPRKYRFTRKISSLLSAIEANKEVINSVDIPLELEDNLRRASILGSALFSARIEGNRLTRIEIEGFSSLPPRDKNKIEVANLNRGINLVLKKFSHSIKVTSSDLLSMQAGAMKNILAQSYCGKFRTAHEGIFDSLGNLVYHCPAPVLVKPMTEDLLKFANSKKERIIPIRAVLAHLSLEDIHPFVDGSGRTGRLLQFAILCMNGYGMKGLIFPEELIDQNRELYYDAIEISRHRNDATEFVELMLKFLAEAGTKGKNQLLARQKENSPIDLLLPRRREIVEIVREHKFVSMDFLHRRFLRVQTRLLSYDLKKLMEQGYIQKIGKTRGALYSART